jgi:catechol-2,3-dioxygenase
VSESRGDQGIAIAGLAEVVLNVHDLDASLGFYRDLLGLTVLNPPDLRAPVFLRAGEAAGLPAMVVLVPLPAGAAEFARPRTLHHLALAVAGADFDAAEQALRAVGYEVRTGQHPVVPSRTLYIDDPDGNEVELIAPL